MATRYKNIYFIGIGGIGMSAIARYFKFKGLNVTGYDKTESELTDALQKEGIDVHYEDNTDFIPKDVENTLVVYTPAIPHDMGELVYVQEHGYKVLKRSKVLGEITDGELPRCFWNTRQDHYKYIDGTYSERKRRRLLGIPGRNFQEL